MYSLTKTRSDNQFKDEPLQLSLQGIFYAGDREIHCALIK